VLSDPRNLLVIDIGNLGDAILSLPALRALRQHFPNTKITVAGGQAGSEIINLSGFADEVIPVKIRVANKVAAGLRAIKLIQQLRQRRFDLVVDLHSTPETNLMMFFTGSKKRLAANRAGRSLDFLSNIRAPRETRGKHAVDRYLDVLAPLGIKNAITEITLPSLPTTNQKLDQLLHKAGLKAGELLIGLNPVVSDGDHSAYIKRLAEIANLLIQNYNAKAMVLVDPEAVSLAREIMVDLPKSRTIFLDKLSVTELISAIGRCTLLITNNSGIMQIGKAVGTPTLALLDSSVEGAVEPHSRLNRILRYRDLNSIDVSEAYEAACELLGKSRTSELFQR